MYVAQLISVWASVYLIKKGRALVPGWSLYMDFDAFCLYSINSSAIRMCNWALRVYITEMDPEEDFTRF